MTSVYAQVRGLGDHDAVRPDAALAQDVDPRQAVAVLFLDRAHHVERVITVEPKVLNELARVNHARHAAALVAGAAAVHVAVFDLSLVRVPFPLSQVAYADSVRMRVHHDDPLA